MERTAKGGETSLGLSRRGDRSAKGTPRSDFDSNPRSRRVNRSLRAAADYAAFAEDLRRDLNPRGSLERLMAEHVVQSAWKLKAALDRQADRDPSTESDDHAPKRPSPSAADRSARSVREAVETFDFFKSRPAPSATYAEIPVETFEPIGAAESVVDLGDDEPEPSVEEADDAEPWRDRLVFDFDISDSSPIVKGTWITVRHVVSEIVDGATWNDILRTHPELTEEDIRACLGYAIAEEC